MNNEDKILEMLVKLDKTQEKQGKLLEQLQSDVSGLKQDVAVLKEDVSGLKEDVAGIKVRLDVEIQTQLNLLSEGYSGLFEKMKTLDQVKDLAEESKDILDVVYYVVKQHSGEIAQLKKAQ